ncbi:unnamed protein product, partial [Coregonus sp. 'balchen']
MSMADALQVEKVENKALKQVFDLMKRQLQVSSSSQRIAKAWRGDLLQWLRHGAERLWKGSPDEEYLYFIEAQVLTGMSTVGCPGLIVPPPFARDPLTLYHSVKGGRDIWVIFNGHQALPEYLITCKKPTYVKPHALFNWGIANKPQKNEDFVIEGPGSGSGCLPHFFQINRLIKDLTLKDPDRNIKVASNMVDWQYQQQPGGQYQSFHGSQGGSSRASMAARGAVPELPWQPGGQYQSFHGSQGGQFQSFHGSQGGRGQYQSFHGSQGGSTRASMAARGAVPELPWQPGGQSQSFRHILNIHLQQALERKQPRVEVSVRGQMHKVTLPDGAATNTCRNRLKSRCIDQLAGQPIESLPQHWDAVPANTSCLSCLIQTGSPEHNEVLNLFRATCPNNVIKIERIQNPTLWRTLQIKKLDMELRNGHQKNEKRLFHGTCHTTIDHINNHGFNRSYAGKN